MGAQIITIRYMSWINKTVPNAGGVEIQVKRRRYHVDVRYVARAELRYEDEPSFEKIEVVIRINVDKVEDEEYLREYVSKWEELKRLYERRDEIYEEIEEALKRGDYEEYWRLEGELRDRLRELEEELVIFGGAWEFTEKIMDVFQNLRTPWSTAGCDVKVYDTGGDYPSGRASIVYYA